MKTSYFLLICFVFLTLIGCKTPVPDSPYTGYTPTTKNYTRDTSLLSYTSYCWTRRPVYFYNVNSQYGTLYPSIIIDTVYYDSTYTKLIATSIHVYNSKEIGDSLNQIVGNDRSFQGRYIIGYRPDTNSIWRLYPWEYKTFSSYGDVNKLKQSLRMALINDLSDYEEQVWDHKTKSLEIKRCEFNINDQGFWEHSIIWQKGVKYSNIYSFEGRRAVLDIYNSNPIDTTVIISYPDSLVSLFTN